VKHFVQYGSIQNQQIYVITKKSSRKYMNCMPTKIRWRHRDQHFNEVMVIFSFCFFLFQPSESICPGGDGPSLWVSRNNR